VPLEMEKMSFSTRRVEGPRERERERAIETVEVFIELSQKTSRWAQIQNPDNVRSSRTKSGGSGLYPTNALWWRKVV
jgi:hypothetical protein